MVKENLKYTIMMSYFIQWRCKVLITREDLAKDIGITQACLRVYLDRAEFNKNRTSRAYLFNMEVEDLERLRLLVRNRRRRKGNYSLLEE